MTRARHRWRLPRAAAVPFALAGLAACRESPPYVSPPLDAAPAPSATLAPGEPVPVRAHGFRLTAPRGWKVSDDIIGREEVISVEGPATAHPPGPSIVFAIFDPSTPLDQAVGDLAFGARQRWAAAPRFADVPAAIPFLGAPRPGHRIVWTKDGITREELLVGGVVAGRPVAAIEDSPAAVIGQVGPILRAVRASFAPDSPGDAPASTPASTPAQPASRPLP